MSFFCAQECWNILLLALPKICWLDMEQLALGRAKNMTRPDTYFDKSQKHLDKFLRQVGAVFCMKPTVYRTNEDKYTYAGNVLTELPD